MRGQTAVFFALSSCIVACSSEAARPPPTVSLPPPHVAASVEPEPASSAVARVGVVHEAGCRAPLSAYCGDAQPCGDYATRSAQLRERVANVCKGSPTCMVGAVLGTCGDLRYLWYADGLMASTEYFDAQGRLVAASGGADVQGFCDGGAFEGTFGAAIECKHVTTVNLNPRSQFRSP